MSKYSGKYDLYDAVFMSSTDKSDIELFEEFKRKTQGKLYQSFKLELNDRNIENELKLNDALSREEIPWPKDGINHRTKRYKYFYYGTEYKNLKQLNKHGYYAKRIIEFEDILDLFPYFTYIITLSYYSEDCYYVQISNKSFLEMEYIDRRKYGIDYSISKLYSKYLKKDLIQLIKDYY